MALTNIRPLYVAPLYQDSAESGRVILRDGTTATIRLVQPGDRDALRAFFAHLSADSRYRRFSSVTLPDEAFLDSVCTPSDLRARLTLIVTRTLEGRRCIIAVGSYSAKDAQTAEVSLAVDDAFQGKGLGTVLVERLALLAIRHGLTRFWALTSADNQPMLEIFRHSGFELREHRDDGHIELDFSVLPSEASVARSETLDRVFTAASLRPFFHPAAIAVVGVSRDPANIGYRIFDALVTTQFNGPVYPVNPSAAVIRSIRAYPNVRSLPEPVDVAVIVVPKPAVLSVIDDCAARGVRAVVVISAGFGEIGEDGRALQQQLVEKVRGYGMRLIGPNCLGLINTDPAVRLNASFSPWYPPHGPVAMMSQSGALGIAILALATQKQLGLSHFVSVGNKADVSGNDLLQYWEQDPAVNTILLYLESFGNPRRFSRIARHVARTKPIVAVKSGRTTAGQRAAGSHTAALAASDVAVDALFHQAGVIRAETLEELFDLTALLSSQPLPKGRSVAIVTNAGGPGILCADACETKGLRVAELFPETKAMLAQALPAAASVSNPVDMIASATPDQFRQTVSTVLSAPEVDVLIAIYIPVGVVQTAHILEGIRAGIRDGRAAGGAGKPILACLMGENGMPQPLEVDQERIPTYLFPESPALVLGKVTDYAVWRATPPGKVLDFDDVHPARARDICRQALAAHGPGWLSMQDAWAVLSAMGLPMAGGCAATTEEAAALARSIGFPVAVKLASRTIIHKTEQKAVYLNCQDEAAVRNAFESIRRPLVDAGTPEAMDGVVVQPMITGAVEVMVGVMCDPSFGPIIAFGLGGIHVGVLRDVVFGITPLTDRDANEMIRAIRGFRLLEGYRGHPAADLEALEEVLLRISLLTDEVPLITELDLNPIFALAPGQGCRLVDARIWVGPTKTGVVQ